MAGDNVVKFKTKSKHKSVKITQATLKKLVKREEPYFIRDTQLTGFAIKVNPTAEAVFRVEARLGGKSGANKTKTIGKVSLFTVKQAKEIATTYLQKLRMGIDIAAEEKEQKNKSKTLQQILDNYIEDSGDRLQETTKKLYRYLMKRYCKGFLSKQCVDIKPLEIKEWYLKEKKLAPKQADKVFRTLNALMRYAVGSQCINRNPCQIVTDARIRVKATKRVRYLEKEELATLLEEISYIQHPEYKNEKIKLSQISSDLLMLLLFTGLRLNEGAGLTWANVDLDNGTILIPDTKNRTDHKIPMSKPIKKMISRRFKGKADGSVYVFPASRSDGHISDIRGQLNKIEKKLGFKFTPHDLRRTFASLADTFGVSQASIKQALNHQDKNVTENYIQPTIEKLRVTFDAVAEEILRWAFNEIPQSKLTDKEKEDIKNHYLNWDEQQENAVASFEIEEGYTVGS